MKNLEHQPQKNSNALKRATLDACLQYGLILAVLNTTKTNTIRIFTQELSLDINYSSRFVQYPHYPIACCFQHLCTVAHNCHGKSINLTAKRKTSQQKEKPHGKKNNLTAKRKTYSKKKNLTAKRKTSRQKETLVANRITSRQKEKDTR